MTRSLPEQEVLKYLAHGHPLPTAEGSSNTTNTLRYAALLTAIVCSPTTQSLSEGCAVGLPRCSRMVCVSCLMYLLRYCFWQLQLCDAVWSVCKFA